MQTDGDQDGVHNLEGVLTRLDHSTRECDEVSIGDALEAFGHRLFGPVVTVAGLLIMSPLGMIPGIPALFGLTVVLVAGQHAVGLDTPWLPSRLTRRRVSRDQLGHALGRLRPWTRRVDRFIRPRYPVLLRDPMPRVLAGVCVVLGLAVVPLEFVPFAAFGPGAAIAAIGLALVGRDGLLAGVGIVLVIASGVAAYYLVR